MRTQTDFLVPMPSLLYGMAKLLNLLGKFTAYNTSSSEEEADAIAIFSDWRIVGEDLSDAMDDYSRSNPDQLELFPPQA